MTERYIRQITFPPIGTAGQKQVGAARVLLVGCGGLGSLIADMLVRAGVGVLRIADRDIVELSNLQRQALFDTDDVEAGLPKAAAAVRKLHRINPEVALEAHVCDVNPHTLRPLLEGVDLLMDGTDNFETRYLLNDAAVEAGIPWVYGGAVASHGMVLPVLPGKTPCLSCLFEEVPPPGTAASCDVAGVISPILHTVAAQQCTEALKLLTGNWKPPAHMTRIDVWEGSWRSIPLADARRDNCPTCARHEFPYLTAEATQQAMPLCGRDAVQLIPPATAVRPDLDALDASLANVANVTRTPFYLTVVAEPYTLTIFPDGRTVVAGTSDPSAARAIHARYLG